MSESNCGEELCDECNPREDGMSECKRAEVTCKHSKEVLVRYLPFITGRIGRVVKCSDCKKKRIIYDD